MTRMLSGRLSAPFVLGSLCGALFAGWLGGPLRSAHGQPLEGEAVAPLVGGALSPSLPALPVPPAPLVSAEAANAADASLAPTPALTPALARESGAPARCDGAPCLSPKRRALAVGAALVPGLLLHGAGSWVAERPRAAKRLFAVQALGLGMMVAGGAPILATYGSPKVTMPGVPLAVTGVGMFASTWIADVWAAAGGESRAGLARAERPYTVDAGAAWGRDPYHGNRGFLELGGSWWWQRLELAPRGRFELNASSVEGGLDARWRLYGEPGSGALLERGHRVDLRLGAFGRNDDNDEIRALWQEAAIGGRFDLRALDEAVAGLFFEAEVGLGLDETGYPNGVWDVGALLLARNALGVYLGRGAGELAFSYSQRRDALVGGLFAGRAAGFLGHVGAELELQLGHRLAMRLGVEYGTALLTSFALRYGGAP
jgi:hypothetical protein